MTDRFIPPDVVAERFEQLKLVLERSALTRHEARVGREEDVLVEGVSKRDPGVLSARTRQGKLVHFDAPSAGKPSAGDPPGPKPSATDPPAGSYARVRVTSAAPHFLRGEFLALTALPRHRVRIPVRFGGRVLNGTSGDTSSDTSSPLVGVGPGERAVAG